MAAVQPRNGDPRLAQAGKVLVVGLGKTGLSCARFLTRQGAAVAVTDTRLHPVSYTHLTLPTKA